MEQIFKSRVSKLSVLLAIVVTIILGVPKLIEWTVKRSYLDGGLYASVQDNDINEVKRMLSLGANPDATNDEGEAAITLAKKLKQNEIIKVLRAAGATDR